MKKFLIIWLLGILPFGLFAQKNDGSIFNEHESINKTKAMWNAFLKGDKETFLSFLCDSVYDNINGVGSYQSKTYFEGLFNYWRNFDNLEVVFDDPAKTTAMDYKDQGLWVLEWIRMKGIHKASGIHVNCPIHNIYGFDKNNKIYAMCQYYDNSIFNEIENSTKIKENGIIYINHPYIVTVRKLVNAYCAKDIETLFSIYAPDAKFHLAYMKSLQVIGVEEKKADDRNTFANYENIQIDQVGYPDCMYYEKDDTYMVYSWWSMSGTLKNGKKISNIPVLMTHVFNKEGKIKLEVVYLSTNHFD